MMFGSVPAEVKAIVGRTRALETGVSRCCLKAGLAIVVALAAGLGVGLGFQLSGVRWPGGLRFPPWGGGGHAGRHPAGVRGRRGAGPAGRREHRDRALPASPASPGGPLPRHAALKEYFDQYFGQMPPGERERAGVGSGVIIDAQGHILTNLHVIKGADEITVRVAQQEGGHGKIVGTDSRTDLAVIRIPAGEGVVAARLGDSDRIEVGEWAIAIGSPFGLEQSVTVGVVSAMGRSEVGIVPNENFIQTDASINPGNSGGPLLNARGEVIGINTAILSSGQGIGFAIPINTAQRVASALISRGRVVRGWMGVSLEPLSDDLASRSARRRAAASS